MTKQGWLRFVGVYVGGAFIAGLGAVVLRAASGWVSHGVPEITVTLPPILAVGVAFREQGTDGQVLPSRGQLLTVIAALAVLGATVVGVVQVGARWEWGPVSALVWATVVAIAYPLAVAHGIRRRAARRS